MTVSKVDCENMKVADAITTFVNTLRKESKFDIVSIVLVEPPKELLERRISFRWQEASLKDALEAISSVADLRYVLDDYGVFLISRTSKSSIVVKELETRREAERWPSSQRITMSPMKFEGMGVWDALQKVRTAGDRLSISGRKVSIGWKDAQEAEQHKVYAWLTHAHLERVVQYICLSAGVPYTCTNGEYIIGTGKTP